MSISRYAVLGVTIADAKAHPAYTDGAVIYTPRVKREGYVISGFVMTAAFYDTCTLDSASGAAARYALRVVRRDVVRGAPMRTLRPATIADVAEMVGGL